MRPPASAAFTLDLLAETLGEQDRDCDTGDGVTATFGGADVIATK